MRIVITQQKQPQWPYASAPELKHDEYQLEEGMEFTADNGYTIVRFIITPDRKPEQEPPTA